VFSEEEWRPLSTLINFHCPEEEHMPKSTIEKVTKADDFTVDKEWDCNWMADCLQLATEKLEPYKAEKKVVEVYSNFNQKNGTRCHIHKVKIEALIEFLKSCNGFKISKD
jgi:hypothetical protein